MTLTGRMNTFEYAIEQGMTLDGYGAMFDEKRNGPIQATPTSPPPRPPAQPEHPLPMPGQAVRQRRGGGREKEMHAE